MENGHIFSTYSRKLYENGYPIIPVAGKAPVLKEWQRYSHGLPTGQEIEEWEKKYSRLNIGLVCGFNIVAVDVDTDDPLIWSRLNKILPPSLVQKRGRKGKTLLYRFRGHPNRKFRLQRNGKPIVEVLGTGCQTVLPGSIHPEIGEPYKWLTPDTLENLRPEELSELPIDFMDQVEVALSDLKTEADDTATTGGRNETLKEQVVAAIHKGKSNEEIVAEVLKFDKNRHNTPLFSDSSDPQMRGHSERENALRFVASIRHSVQMPEPTPKKWGPIKELPRLLPEAARLTPELADDMLPEPLKPWLCDIARRLQVPLESVTVCAFGGLGALIGRKISIYPKRYDDWSTLAGFWTAIIDRPGRKKTPTINEALKPLEIIETELREEYEKNLAKAKAEQSILEARIAAVKDKIKIAIKDLDESLVCSLKTELEKLNDEQDEKSNSEKRIRTNDATVEKLAQLLNENPNGILLFRDELCGWLNSFEKNGFEGAREFFLEAWNSQRGYVVDRVGRGTIHIPSLFISVMGGIQPGKLESYIVQATRGGSGDDGLLQRFQLAVYPEKLDRFEYVDAPPDLEARERAEYIFKRIHKLTPEELDAKCINGREIPGVRFSAAAQELFDEWNRKLELRLHSGEIENAALESHLSKYRSLMPGLALVFHLVDFADHRKVQDGVSLESARRAALWCDFLEEHAKKIYACATDTEVHAAHALAQKIKEGSVEDGTSLRNIYRHHWSKLDTQSEVESAVMVLEGCNWVRTERKAGEKGAPTEVLRLHPDLIKRGEV